MSTTPQTPGIPGAADGAFRVALVLNDFRPAGSERQALMLALELKQRGCQVVLLGLGGSGPLGELATRQDVASEAIHIQYPLSWWRLPHNLLHMLMLLRRHRPHVVIGYTSVPNLYAGLLWRRAGAKGFIWNQRDAGLDRPAPCLERWALARTSVFVANSPAGMDFVINARGGRRDGCHLIPNGIQLFPKNDYIARKPHEQLRVLCLANGREAKDHPTLLRAWAIVWKTLKEAGIQAQLCLAGYFQPNSDYARSVIRLAGAPELEGSVEIHEQILDVRPYVARFHIGVLSSATEGLPNAILEYMEAGMPVVATDLPGTRFIMGPQAEHCLVPVGDEYALAERILELAQDPNLCMRWGAWNREQAEQRFTAAGMADRMFALIRKCAGVS